MSSRPRRKEIHYIVVGALWIVPALAALVLAVTRDSVQPAILPVAFAVAWLLAVGIVIRRW